MTPLACELLEDVYDRVHIRKTRTVSDEHVAGRLLWRLVHDCKFFECSAVWPLAHDLAAKMLDSFERHDRVDQKLAFLPAQNTWIETEQPSLRGLIDGVDRQQRVNQMIKLDTEDLIKKSPYNYRSALVLIGQHDSTHFAERYRISYETPRQPGPRIWRVHKMPVLPLVHSGMKPQRAREHTNQDGIVRTFDEPVPSTDDFVAYGHLSLINSPRVIGQRQHNPHERIEREKLKRLKLVGKFPLRAWTEILLHVTTNPEDRSDDATTEAHLTGERCLHYCRTYLRVRMGMLEYVEGHWRGNPALGMKRSRYRIEKEKQQ